MDDHTKEFINMWYGSFAHYRAIQALYRLRHGSVARLVLKDYDAALAEAEQRLARFQS